MATICSLANIRSEGNLSGVTDDSLLQPHLDKAELELRRKISTDVYDEVIALEATVEKKRELIKAEANLALSYAVHTLNVVTSGQGIISSKGFGDSKSELLTSQEVESLSKYYRSIYDQFVTPYAYNEEIDLDADVTSDDILNLGSSSFIAI